MKQRQANRPPASPTWTAFADLLANFSIFFLFSFFLEKGRVFEPAVIQNQFTFRQFDMVQMFLSALLGGQIAMSLLSLLPSALHLRWFCDAEDAFIKKHMERGVLAAALGSFLTGVGMALAGTCPGTIYAQLGAGVRSARWVLVGSLMGAYLYSLVSGYVKPWLFHIGKHRKGGTVYHHLERDYAQTAAVSISVLVVILSALLYAVPTSNVTVPHSIWDALTTKAWPPYLAGFGIGLLEIPAIIFLKTPLGASTHLVALLSPLTPIPGLVPSGSELAKFPFPSWITFKKLMAVMGAVMGGYVSAQLSASRGTTPGLAQSEYLVFESAPIQAVVGGVALLFGSRLAGGCTSGHGISGMGLLVVNSVVAVPSMFAGAILTGMLLRQA